MLELGRFSSLFRHLLQIHVVQYVHVFMGLAPFSVCFHVFCIHMFNDLPTSKFRYFDPSQNCRVRSCTCCGSAICQKKSGQHGCHKHKCHELIKQAKATRKTAPGKTPRKGMCRKSGVGKVICTHQARQLSTTLHEVKQ